MTEQSARTAALRVVRRWRISGAHADANALWALRERLAPALASAVVEERVEAEGDRGIESLEGDTS